MSGFGNNPQSRKNPPQISSGGGGSGGNNHPSSNDSSGFPFHDMNRGRAILHHHPHHNPPHSPSPFPFRPSNGPGPVRVGRGHPNLHHHPSTFTGGGAGGPMPIREELIIHHHGNRPEDTAPKSGYGSEDAMALLKLANTSSKDDLQGNAGDAMKPYGRYGTGSFPPLSPSASPAAVHSMILQHQQRHRSFSQQYVSPPGNPGEQAQQSRSLPEKREEAVLRYSVDFGVGVELRKNVLLPLKKKGCGPGGIMALALGKYFRGERVLFRRKDPLSSKRRADPSSFLEETDFSKRQKVDEEAQTQVKCAVNEGELIASPTLKVAPAEDQSSKPTNPQTIHQGRILRCNGKDAATLSSWYHEKGDKTLSYTNENWSEWWERRCGLPDPGCEMIKLVARPHGEGEEEIMGVAYYERNVVDRHSASRRVTILRGLRLSPLVNDEVLRRNRLQVLTQDTGPFGVYNGLASVLLHAVLSRSLLCGTSGVCVNAVKSDISEKFFSKYFGNPVAFCMDNDGRKFFRMGEEERWNTIRNEFERQCDIFKGWDGLDQEEAKMWSCGREGDDQHNGKNSPEIILDRDASKSGTNEKEGGSHELDALHEVAKDETNSNCKLELSASLDKTVLTTTCDSELISTSSPDPILSPP